MHVPTNTRLPRRGALIALVALICAAVAATGFAAVTIYSNNFKSRSDFKTVRKVAGGKPCDRNWVKRKAFGITAAKGKTVCAYEPPVYADGSGADQSVKAVLKVLSEGANKKTKRGAFGFLAMRASDTTRYQLRVFPKNRRWELRRGPGSKQFPVKGKLKKIAPLDKRNTVQMRLTGDRVDVWVQGKRVVRGLSDSAAAEVSGNAVRVGLGQTRKTKRPTSGLFNLLRIDLPTP